MKIILRVKTRCCRGCEKKVNKVIRKIEGVDDVEIDADNDQVIVHGHAVDHTAIIKKLKKASKPAELLLIDHGDKNQPAENSHQMQNKVNDEEKKKEVKFALPPEYIGGGGGGGGEEDKSASEGHRQTHVGGGHGVPHLDHGYGRWMWPEAHAPNPYYYNNNSHYGEDPLNMFNDDNVNGCSIM